MAKLSAKKFYAKNCLFGANIIVANNDKEKYVYSGYRKAFDGKGHFSFGNDSARNVTIFEFDNSYHLILTILKMKF